MVECITLQDAQQGSSAKILCGFGFNCFSFVARDSAGDVELLWSEPEFESGAKRPSGSGTPILFPFPGRLPGMTFQWDGVDYPLESDDGRGNGIHGFVHRRPWRVIQSTETSVTGEFQASLDDPSLLDRWPADFQIQAKYELCGNRLDCEMTISNPDERPLPCGLGSHPYFRIPLGQPNSNAAACRVRLPVASEWRLDEMLPTGERIEADPSLAEGAAFESLKLDNVFSGLARDDDKWFRAEITDAGRQRRLEVAFDELFPECVVYTPPHREAICIEPYTCVPGAAGRSDFAHGWRVMAPGNSQTGRLRLELKSTQ